MEHSMMSSHFPSLKKVISGLEEDGSSNHGDLS